MTTGLLLTVQPLLSIAATHPTPSSLVDPKSAESERIKVLEIRVLEIKEMDKSKLKPAEKKMLRKELRSIKTELKETEARGGGMYLSVGAIIIIILLLIIIF